MRLFEAEVKYLCLVYYYCSYNECSFCKTTTDGKFFSEVHMKLFIRQARFNLKDEMLFYFPFTIFLKFCMEFIST